MKHFVFCNGFGFNAYFWKNLLPFFKDEEYSIVNFGYFEEQNFPPLPNNKKIIAIGHSLGVVKLLNLYPQIDYLIGLNGFINFLGNDIILHKQRMRELNLLINGMQKNLLLTLKNFYKNCGKAEFANYIDFEHIKLELLLQDLSILKKSYNLPNIKTLIIGAKDDIVVPDNLIADNFKQYPYVKIIMLENGKHMLGFDYADEIFKQIMNFINGN